MKLCFYFKQFEETHKNNLRNKNQPEAFSFFIYSNKYPLHVSNRLTIHNQEAVHCTCSLWYLSRVIIRTYITMHDPYNVKHTNKYM